MSIKINYFVRMEFIPSFGLNFIPVLDVFVFTRLDCSMPNTDENGGIDPKYFSMPRSI